MKKSLEDELMSLAHRVLQLRGSDDVHELKAMARELYEKLAILSFAEKHFEGPKPTIGCYDVEQALEEEQHENEATAVADGDEPESAASEKPDQPSETLEKEQPEERDYSPEEETEVIERVETEQPETTVEEQESAVEEVSIEETTEEIEVEESTEELEEEKQKEEETTSIENLEVNTPVSVDVDPEESEPVSEPTAEVATEDEGEENSKNTESEKIIEDPIEAEEPVATGMADYESEDQQGESEPEEAAELELTDDLRDIAVHYDDLPDFEPIDFSMDENEPKEVAEEPALKSFDFEPTEEEEQPKPTPDLFSTAKKVRTRNDLKPSRKSLNERLNHGLKFGLNDRLAFANHLFNGDSADFDRVVSQLNTISTYPEAEAFIKEQIKPDYNWENEELYEERFLMAIEKRMGN